jgi:hypothetical protein
MASAGARSAKDAPALFGETMSAAMPDVVTVDVVDRPVGGVLRAVRHARAIRTASPAAMRALLVLGTARFVPRLRVAPTLRRLALLAVWKDREDVDALWTDAFGDLCSGAREHWHVEAEVVRAVFSVPWKGWVPDVADARPLDLSEPALIVISGDLRARYVPAFYWDGGVAIRHAFAQPGYLGGLFVVSSPLNTTSCTCWRTYKDARDFAFKPGGHADAMRRDRAGGHHKTDYFLRLRPLTERGSLAGASPLAPVLVQIPS